MYFTPLSVGISTLVRCCTFEYKNAFSGLLRRNGGVGLEGDAGQAYTHCLNEGFMFTKCLSPV
jgi:hypothetical protein